MKEEIKQCITYVAEDGRRFTHKEDCRRYEIELKRPKVYIVTVEYRGYRTGEKVISVCSTREVAEKILSDINYRNSYEERYRIAETTLIDS